MILVYNGIQLELAQINRIERTAIYDETETDYLHTEWLIDVVAIYNNDGGTSATRRGVFVPINQKPSATITDIALRFLLMQPRKELLLMFASNPNELLEGVGPYETMLQCPSPGYACDVGLGPKPLRCVITEAMGEGTFAVQYVVKCYTNECGGVSGTGDDARFSPIVLSNRFTMHHHVDDMQYTTRVIEGIAHFRADALNKIQGGLFTPAFADEFRKMFSFSVPKNFQRQDVDVTQSPDGTSVHYRIVDQEKSQNIDVFGSGAVKVEMQHYQSLNQDSDLLTGTIGSLRAYLDFKTARNFSRDPRDDGPPDSPQQRANPNRRKPGGGAPKAAGGK